MVRYCGPTVLGVLQSYGPSWLPPCTTHKGADLSPLIPSQGDTTDKKAPSFQLGTSGRDPEDTAPHRWDLQETIPLTDCSQSQEPVTRCQHECPRAAKAHSISSHPTTMAPCSNAWPFPWIQTILHRLPSHPLEPPRQHLA